MFELTILFPRSAVIHGLKANDAGLDKMYYQFGPTAQICFNLLQNKTLLAEYTSHYNSALKNLSSEKFGQMVSHAGTFNMDTESHTLLLLRRMPRKDLIIANLDISDGADFTYASVEPITHAVEVALKNQLWKQSRNEQLELYDKLASVEGNRG
jgi:hypothetical protein